LKWLGRLNEHHDDDEGEQGEGLDEGQTQGKQQQDAGACSWIAGDAFSSGCSGAALTDTATCGGEAHADTGGDGDESSLWVRARRGLCESRNGKAQHRQSGEAILH
jgi:hypothetical protein